MVLPKYERLDRFADSKMDLSASWAIEFTEKYSLPGAKEQATVFNKDGK